MSAAFVARRFAAHHAATTSYSATVSGITAGNFLVLAVALPSSGLNASLSSVTDNASNAWAVNESRATITTRPGIGFASTRVGSAPTSITVNLSANIDTSLVIAEFSGVSSFDTGNNGTAAAASNLVSSAVTPSQAGELVVVAFAPQSAQSTFTPGADSAGGSFLSVGAAIGGSPDCVMEYILSCPSGSQTGAADVNASSAYSNAIGAFFLALPPGPAVGTELQAVTRAAVI